MLMSLSFCTTTIAYPIFLRPGRRINISCRGKIFHMVFTKLHLLAQLLKIISGRLKFPVVVGFKQSISLGLVQLFM